MDSKRDAGFDVMRIMASFMVVMLHVSGSYWSCVDVNSREFVILTVFNGMARCAVPLFIMISGRFLLNPEKEENAGTIVRRCRKMLICFCVWSVFYGCQSVVFHFLTGKDVDWQMIENMLERIYQGHYHMWYLWMLLGLYLITPICRQIVKDRKLTRYLLILCMVFNVIVPMLGTPWDALKRTYFPFTSYVGYYIAGYYISVEKPLEWLAKGFKRTWLICTGGVGLLYIIVMTLYECRESETYTEQYFYAESIGVVLYSVAIFMTFCMMQERQSSQTLRIVAGSTFFVYLFHPFCIEKLNIFGVNVIMAPAIVTVPVLSVTIWLICVGIAVGLKKFRCILME